MTDLDLSYGNLPYGKRTFDELEDLLDSMLADPQTDPWDIARLNQFIETRGASEELPTSYEHKQGLGVVAGVPDVFVVHNGQQCIGFVIARACQGHEAFDRQERSLGLFKTAAQAANAVFDAAEGEKR
jgi:hypothetical protein